jgi:hypothetical protein
MKISRVLNHIWEDIKRGENIDLYITVSAAIVLAIVNVSGFSTVSYLPTITLAILALLAISSLGNRYRLDRILQGETINEVFLYDYPDDYEKRIIEAKEVIFVGVNLRRTVFRLTTKITQKLEDGHQIMVLLVHPDGIGNSAATLRLFEKNAYDRVTEQEHSKVIKMVLEHLTSKKKGQPKANLEIKTIDYPLHFGAVATDPNSPHATIYIEHYNFKMRQDDLPKMVLTRNDGPWFDHYKLQIDTLWEKASYWKASEIESDEDKI